MDVAEEWETKYGKVFMEKVGVQKGDRVIDLGCNVGRYSIVLALVVGETGTIYAVDKDRDPLNKLKRRIKNSELTNVIEIVRSDGIPDSIEEESIDFVLLYDILHYLEREERAKLYRDIHSVLKSVSGILSIHPKHSKDDGFPVWNFKDLTVKEIVMEVEEYGYIYEEKICDILWHRDGPERGCVYNFIKKME